MMMKHYLYDFAGYNIILFNKINQFFGQEESYILAFANQLGYYWSFPVVFSLIMIYCYFSILSTKDSKKLYEQQITRWSITLITLLASLVIMLIIVSLIKLGYSYKRPFCHDGLENIKIFTSALPGAHCSRSFPSGHTAYVCTILFAMWPMLNLFVRLIGIFLAISIALSRIASGVHFPADIFWSALISLIAVVITRYTIQALMRRLSPRMIKYMKSVF